MGKITEKNKEATVILNDIYREKGIVDCELKMLGCWRNKHVHYAHRHKRIWYRSRPDLLHAFSETIKACNHCHQKIEYDLELSEKVFVTLRDNPEAMENTFSLMPKRDYRVTQSMSGAAGEITKSQYFAIINNIRGLSTEQSNKLKHITKETASKVINMNIQAINPQQKQQVYDYLERVLLKQ